MSETNPSKRLDSFNIYRVDPTAPDIRDVEDIAKAFRAQYGDHYFDVFLDPERLTGLVSKPGTLTFVARNDEGEFVGTGSLITKGSRAELGRTVVPREFRGPLRFKGRRVYDALIEERMKVAYHEAIDMLYTAAVTWKADSQAGLERRSLSGCALQDQKYIQITPAELGVGRESTILMLYRGSNFAVDHNHVYVTEDLTDVVEQTLDSLRRPLAMPVFYNNPRHDLERFVDTKARGFNTHVKVDAYGLDTQENKHLAFALHPQTDLHSKGERVAISELGNYLHDQIECQGLRYAEVELGVNNATSRRVAEELRETGFKVAGFLPGWHRQSKREDALLLTYAKPGQPDLERLDTTPENRWIVDAYREVNR